MQLLAKEGLMLYFVITIFGIFWQNSFHIAHLSVQVEAGAELSTDLSLSRPADIFVQDWDRGKPATFDISVVSPLNSSDLFACSGNKIRCSIRGS